MDGNVLHRVFPPHARNVLFQRVLVGDAVCLGGQRRRARGASAAGGALVGSGAGACGSSGVRCTAATSQRHSGSQHQCPCAKGPPGTAVFCLLHRVLLSLLPLFFEGGASGSGVFSALAVCSILCYLYRQNLNALVETLCTQQQASRTRHGKSSVCTVSYSRKKCPPRITVFGGHFKNKFWGFWAFPVRNPPKKPKIGGIWGRFSAKTGNCGPSCAGFPLAATCGKESRTWNEGHF